MLSDKDKSIHEAGHIALAIKNGFSFSMVTIDNGDKSLQKYINTYNVDAGGGVDIMLPDKNDIKELKGEWGYKKTRKMIEKTMQVYAAGVVAQGIEERGEIPSFNGDYLVFSGVGCGDDDYRKAIEVGQALFKPRTLINTITKSHFEAGRFLIKKWFFVEMLSATIEEQRKVFSDDVFQLWRGCEAL